MAIEQLRTVQGNDATRAGEDTHGADILLAKSVLDSGHNGADSGCLDHGAHGVCEGIAGVEGGVVGGHGGRNGASVSSSSKLSL